MLAGSGPKARRVWRGGVEVKQTDILRTCFVVAQCLRSVIIEVVVVLSVGV